MFQQFIQFTGRMVSRHWKMLIPAWILVVLLVRFVSPALEEVVQDGEFVFLPEDSPSLIGEELYATAFPKLHSGSRVVIVASHPDSEAELQQEDKDFVLHEILPEIEKIVEQQGGLAFAGDEPEKEEPEAEQSRSLVSKVRSFDDKHIGRLLVSDDNRAVLIIVEFATEFLDKRTHPTIALFEQLVRDKSPKAPPGLELTFSGSSTVGRDLIEAARESANSTELWTKLLVIVLLILIYRAPFLALIPLVTVMVSTRLALNLLSMCAAGELLDLFNGIEVYVTVVLYGAGVDYCMFLISRYKEELDSGFSQEEAIEKAIVNVGPALAASAGTTICGLAMMAFAQFGKFHQAGIAMSFSLVFVLAASLTLAPALLMLAGRWAFWPQAHSEKVASGLGWVSPTSLIVRLFTGSRIQRFWEWIAQCLLVQPGKIWVCTVLLMSPFALLSLIWYQNLSYGLLSELSSDRPSVRGAASIQSHFPAGMIGPVSILIRNDECDFALDEEFLLEDLVAELQKQKERIGIHDIRSVTQPLGESKAARLMEQEIVQSSGAEKNFKRGVLKNKTEVYYVGDADENNEDLAGNVGRIEVLFDRDPFTRFSITQLNLLSEAFDPENPASVLPEELRQNTEIHFIGPSASIRDLRSVTREDQVLIHTLVIWSVLLVLILLLKKVAISIYLIISVFFSYLATLGVTFVLFWAMDPSGFSGIDWKVPIFLFTILIAVGEDYNIYLIARIEEEQKKHGLIQGIVEALTRTGSIISSCGIIMAGTFASLMSGSLVGMQQLGFALAFGVILDTFVVRPILVPAYLIMLHRGRFGTLGRFLGAENEADREDDETPPAAAKIVEEVKE